MPIAATFPALKAQIANALSLDKGSTTDTFSLNFTNALASIVVSGIYPPASNAPLVPAGFAGMQPQLKNSVSLDKGSTPDTTSQAMAASVTILVPMVPPVGQIALQTQLKNALSLDKGATPDTVASSIANALISYYTTGGAI
jgi:hypothetical protein